MSDRAKLWRSVLSDTMAARVFECHIASILMRLLATATFLMALTAVLRAQEAVDVPAKQRPRPAASPAASVEPTIPPDLPEVSQLDEMFKRSTSSLGRRADEVRL